MSKIPEIRVCHMLSSATQSKSPSDPLYLDGNSRHCIVAALQICGPHFGCLTLEWK